MERRDTIEIAQAEVREPGDQRAGHGGEIRTSPTAEGASGRARGESTLAEGVPARAAAQQRFCALGADRLIEHLAGIETSRHRRKVYQPARRPNRSFARSG